MACISVLLVVILGGLQLLAWSDAATLNFAVVVDKGSTAVKQAVEKAISDINSKSTILNGHVVKHTVFETDGLNRFAVVQTMCQTKPLVKFDAVVDVTTTEGRCASLSIAQALDAAFMGAHREQCYSEPLPSVHFDNDVYFKALALVALQQNASREAMAVFYDSSFDIGALIPMEKVQYVPTYMYKVPNTDAEIKDMLSNIKTKTPASEFVIAASVKVADRILKQANDLSMMSNILHWFVVTRDLDSLTCAGCGSNQVIQIGHKIEDNALKTALATAVSSWTSLAYRQLNVIFAYEAMLATAKALSALPDPSAGNSSFECYTPTNLTLNRYTNYIDKVKNLPSYSGVISKIRFNGTVVTNDLNLQVSFCTASSKCEDSKESYSAASDSLTSAVKLTYQIRPRLDVIAIHDPPFVFKNGTNFTGYSISCLKYLSEKLNFDFDIRDPVDQKYGVKQANGAWNGMIGEVALGKADIAIGPFTITAERESIVDMTIPYYDYAGLQIVMARKVQTDSDMFYFLTVFTLSVWLCIGATLFITGILVTVFDKLSPYSFQNKTEWEEGEPEGKIFTIKESMWFVLGAYTMAGESFDPRATSTRMLVAGFWIFSFIMYAMYTANLAASLTVSKLTATINSVRELSAQTDTKYTVISDTIGETFFSRMKNIESNFFQIWKDLSIGNEYTVGQVSKYSVWEYPIEERYTDMYDRMVRWGLAKDTAAALEKMKQKDKPWAAFLETPFIKYLKGQDCTLYNVGEVLSSRPYGIVLKNKSPLTRQMNLIILEMQRDRVMEDYKVDWWNRNKKDCPVLQDSGGIKLEQLGGVFIFLAGGVACGGLALIIEVIVVRMFGKERFMPDEMDKTNMGGARPVTSIGSRISMRLQSARSRSSSSKKRDQSHEMQGHDGPFSPANNPRQNAANVDDMGSGKSRSNWT